MPRSTQSPPAPIRSASTVFVALATTALLAGCAEPTRRARAPTPTAETLEVMTYNVNFGLAGDPATLRAIVDADADLVLLQETTPAWEAAIERELGQAYPHRAFRHSRGAGGQAVLARAPFALKEVIPAPSGWFPALRLIANTKLGQIQVLAVHLHPPVSDSGSVVSGFFTTGKVRRGEIEQFFAHLEPGLPTLVVGDFNENRHGRAISFLAKQGLRSALPEFAPDANTWRWNTSLGTVHSQLDHIVYSEELTPVDARVINVGRSDHLPVIGVFELADLARSP